MPHVSSTHIPFSAINISKNAPSNSTTALCHLPLKTISDSPPRSSPRSLPDLCTWSFVPRPDTPSHRSAHRPCGPISRTKPVPRPRSSPRAQHHITSPPPRPRQPTPYLPHPMAVPSPAPPLPPPAATSACSVARHMGKSISLISTISTSC